MTVRMEMEMKGRGKREEFTPGKSEYKSREDFKGFVSVGDCDGPRV